MLERVARGERIEHDETEVVRKDGSLLSSSLNPSPIRNDHGTVVGHLDIPFVPVHVRGQA